jgi:hypothetical protein
MAIQRNQLREVDEAERQNARGYIHRQKWTDAATADTDLLLNDQATSSSVTTTVTSFLAQPDVPRNIVITPGGTTTDVPAGDVTVTGTNIRNEVITEAFTFAANASSATTGAKAFKTVTSIVFPIQDGAAATYDVGTGVKLGLDRKLTEASVIDAYVDGVRETTAATVAISSTVVESNTVSTNTAPNASRDFVVYMITTEITDERGTTS